MLSVGQQGSRSHSVILSIFKLTCDTLTYPILLFKSFKSGNEWRVHSIYFAFKDLQAFLNEECRNVGDWPHTDTTTKTNKNKHKHDLPVQIIGK